MGFLYGLGGDIALEGQNYFNNAAKKRSHWHGRRCCIRNFGANAQAAGIPPMTSMTSRIKNEDRAA